MAAYRCGTCGQVHAALPLDLSYQRPAAYFAVPAAHRSSRIQIDADLCVIDGQQFYIRGILPLPIGDGPEEFRWGVWAQVSEADFQRYLALWDATIGPTEAPLPGRLAGGIRTYDHSDGLAVEAWLQPNGQRPRFMVVDGSHPLGRDQRAGIALAQVHDFVAPFLLRDEP